MKRIILFLSLPFIFFGCDKNNSEITKEEQIYNLLWPAPGMYYGMKPHEVRSIMLEAGYEQVPSSITQKFIDNEKNELWIISRSASDELTDIQRLYLNLDVAHNKELRDNINTLLNTSFEQDLNYQTEQFEGYEVSVRFQYLDRNPASFSSYPDTWEYYTSIKHRQK